ncbi:MAG TPA: carbamoyltransferase HypF [Candidatus Sulfotelmatobacter sp.]|jgi:hydrogenase maturation protein HypF|nr:carbamoyltransferase HypF [Candidatus Sulfotelmatobacter sp.]
MTETVRTSVARKAIEITGIVQGVGFRPYVYRLANECGLTGLIANTSAGVSIEVQGEAEAVERFLERLPKEIPPLAKVTGLAPRSAEVQQETAFLIKASSTRAAAKALISPDVSVCEDCLRELMNPRDRRFRYPFINCTNCGPRFTIIHDIPYDRARTAMAKFKMCAACQAEYENPASRRFHAQPNACWDCGPQVGLLGADGARMDVAEPIREAARLLQQGSVVAIKGLGGFHLACDAQNEKAVGKLRERKRRVEKPFAIMVRRVEDASRFCVVDELSKKLMHSFERPIVLLPRRPEVAFVPEVAPGNRFLDVFLPYTPLHHLLFQSGKFEALVMTSGNLSEEPIAIDNEEAVRRLNGIADAFLVHDREIVRRCDDSVVRVAASQPQKLRRSRGFVPVPVQLEKEVQPVLAVGGELKNTVCVVRGSEAFLSQHVGDLENLESYKFFEEAVQHLQRILETEPKVIAHDLHPDYFSTKWAQERTGVELVGVQHHHAHVAACMAENHLDGKVIGVALDGTGYGTDGAIWGGEVLVADYTQFERAAHFEYVALPGGAAAIHEPWRMAVSYLAKHYGKAVETLGLPFLGEIDSRKLSVVLQMMEREINSPRTSSCGRLFDAVAALVGLRGTVNYEAQAAIELEMAARDSGSEAAYPLDLDLHGTIWQIGTKPLFDWLLKDIRQQASVADISRKFHNGLALVFVDAAERIRDRTQLNRVCLSGGCFLNALLLETMITEMKERSFEVFFHTEVPAGDGGISLGQAVIAGRRVGS